VGDNLNEASESPPSSSSVISLVTVDDSRESKQDEPTDTVTTSPTKTTLTLLLQVKKTTVPFSNMLKGRKDQAILIKLGRPYPRSRLTYPCRMLSSRCLHMLDF